VTANSVNAKSRSQFKVRFTAVVNRSGAELKHAHEVLGALGNHVLQCHLPSEVLGHPTPPNTPMDGFRHLVTRDPVKFVFQDDLANLVQEALALLCDNSTDAISALVYIQGPFNAVVEAYFFGRMKLVLLEHSGLCVSSLAPVTKTLIAQPSYVQHCVFPANDQPTVDQLLSNI